MIFGATGNSGFVRTVHLRLELDEVFKNLTSFRPIKNCETRTLQRNQTSPVGNVPHLSLMM